MSISDRYASEEKGWKRLRPGEKEFSFLGDGWFNNSGHDYLTDCNSLQDYNSKLIRFNIKNTKRIRIYGYSWGNRSDQEIFINKNIKKEYSNSKTTNDYILIYENNNLKLRENYITIKAISNGYFGIQCVDIDENGEILPYKKVNESYILLKQNENIYSIKQEFYKNRKFEKVKLISELSKSDFKKYGINDLNIIFQKIKINENEEIIPIDVIKQFGNGLYDIISIEGDD